jgi:signal transduction histidine kinase
MSSPASNARSPENENERAPLPAPWDTQLDVSADEFLTKTHVLIYEYPMLALAICQRAIAQAQERQDKVGLLRARLRLVTVQHALGDAAWRDELNQIEADARSLGDNLLILRVLMAQQSCRSDGAECAESLAVCEAALPLALSLGQEDLICRILGNGASSLSSIGEHSLALEFYQELRRHIHADHPMAAWHTAMTHGHEAVVHLRTARELMAADDANNKADDKVKSHLAQACSLAQQSCEEFVSCDQGSFYEPLLTLISALLEHNEVSRAREHLQQFLERSPEEPPALGSYDRAVLELTHAMVELHEPDVALAQTLRRLKIAEAQPHPDFREGEHACQVLNSLSTVYERLHDNAKALDCFRRCVAIRARTQSLLARERAKVMRRTLMALRGETEEFITHDLRVPMSTALSSVQSMHMQASDAQVQSGLRRAAHNVMRAMGIADHYLMMTRAENLQRNALTLLDLADLTEEVCEQMSVPAAASVQLLREIQPKMPILGDRILLMRVLGNLLSNAFKHSPHGSTVCVRVVREKGEASLSVCDSGPGLPAAMRARLFQRYAASGPRGSNGLGLALVARAARLHGARVSVENGPQGGAMVVLRFALAVVD